MCTIFYQPQHYCGITILINFPLWRMSVVVGVALGVLTNVFLHISELDKYAHIVSHLHVPYACKGDIGRMPCTVQYCRLWWRHVFDHTA